MNITKLFALILALIGLTGCSHHNVKPQTLPHHDKVTTVKVVQQDVSFKKQKPRPKFSRPKFNSVMPVWPPKLQSLPQQKAIYSTPSDILQKSEN